MSSTLSTIPIDKRRQLAATLGLFAVLFVAVGIVSTTGRTNGAVVGFSAIALGLAGLLALAAWRVSRSIRLELAEHQLDDAIAASIAKLGSEQLCGCGHDHNPDELHVEPGAPVANGWADDGCADDGKGVDCSHDCASCVLASMRPSPTRSRASRFAE